MTLKAWSAAVGLVGVCVACGSDPKDDGFKKGQFGGAGSSAGGGANGGAFGTGSISGTGSFLGTGSGTGNGGGPAVDTCATGVYAAESIPVDAYMMFDQSTSMACDITTGACPATSNNTWWNAAVPAVKAFVVDPSVQNMAMGIQYFGLNGIAPGSCDVAQYATPEVPIAPLSTNSGLISTSIDGHSPVSFTPTEPALQGAIDHLTAWAPSHPGRAPAVVLVTDGFPSECDLTNNSPGTAPSITNIANRAAAAYAGPYKIRTFVIGFLNGAGVSNLEQVAIAGGTKKAFLIDPAAGDVGAQFRTALLSISNSTLQCNFPLPAPPGDAQTLDPRTVRMYYTPNASGVKQEIPWLDNNTLCGAHGNNGWYYDSQTPETATRIWVCSGTCENFAAGIVEIGAGCQENTPIE